MFKESDQIMARVAEEEEIPACEGAEAGEELKEGTGGEWDPTPDEAEEAQEMEVLGDDDLGALIRAAMQSEGGMDDEEDLEGDRVQGAAACSGLVQDQDTVGAKRRASGGVLETGSGAGGGKRRRTA